MGEPRSLPKAGWGAEWSGICLTVPSPTPSALSSFTPGSQQWQYERASMSEGHYEKGSFVGWQQLEFVAAGGDVKPFLPVKVGFLPA